MDEIPLKPAGKEEIRKLELSLILGTLFRPDVLESIRMASDKVTWLDSLIVAAGALARERAGMTTSKIAEELG
ncbi:MAG: transcriptional regulator, partial [Candidatus Aenigmatarchaeota archaeon]